MIGSLVDAALEVSVIGSFTRVGSAIRRRLFGWEAPSTGALAGRTILVTGPTSGLGRAVAFATHARPAETNGRLYLDRRARPFDRIPSTRLSSADRRRLWDLVARLAEVPDPA